MIEHSKPKHLHNKWQHNADDSDPSWRIEYSDKGSDGDDLSYAPKAKLSKTKPLIKKPKPQKPSLTPSNKGTVPTDIQQSLQQTGSLSAVEKQEVDPSQASSEKGNVSECCEPTA